MSTFRSSGIPAKYILPGYHLRYVPTISTIFVIFVKLMYRSRQAYRVLHGTGQVGNTLNVADITVYFT